MRALDLYCGLGGWSDGLSLEGFDIVGVEIEPKIAKRYKHKVIIADCQHLPLRKISWELIVGSPPCRDFSIIGTVVGHRWNRPPDPEGVGMDTINAFLDYVELCEHSYWLMENVPRACEYVRKQRGIEPRTITKLGRNMKRALWGNFPSFLITRDFNKKVIGRLKKWKIVNGERKLIRIHSRSEINDGTLRKWEDAKIPLPTARAIGRAVRNVLK